MTEAPVPPDVTIHPDSSGGLTWFKPSTGPGPIFHIAADGTLTVFKLGTHEELAKLFWESVMFQGINYTQKLQGAEQMIATLFHDPTRQVIMEGEYEVFKHLKKEGAGVSMNTVRKVLEAVKSICQKETN